MKSSQSNGSYPWDTTRDAFAYSPLRFQVVMHMVEEGGGIHDEKHH